MSAADARRTPAIPLILGPTGAGKTDLALRLAERCDLEIVSVDSAMVYRGMDIGTGKPPAEVLRQHPHHLVDILDPLQAYSAGQFVRDARRAIDDIRARGQAAAAGRRHDALFPCIAPWTRGYAGGGPARACGNRRRSGAAWLAGTAC